MKERAPIFRYLIKVSGKILFVIGLVLNILMVFFGFWPSYIYLLILIFGWGMVYFNKTIYVNTNPWHINIRRLRLPPVTMFSTSLFRTVLKISLASILSIVILCVGFFWATRDHFKKLYTKRECQELLNALNEHYSSHKKYPTNLSEIISKNPLRKSWSRDEWNNLYLFKTSIDRQRFTLQSAGRDGVFGNNDDLIFYN